MKESTDEKSAPDIQQIELNALAEIVAVQAQAINDMIVSLNNLQRRMAALEQPQKVAKSNGHGIIRLS